MAWDDGNNKDPWRSRGNQGPADLDAIIRDLQRKLGGIFGGRGRNRDSGDRGAGPGVSSGLLVGALAVIGGLWALTGFYIVDEAERAVVLRFGKYSTLSEPGLRWHLPWPLETAVNVNTEEMIRLPYQGSMLTRDENIVNVDLIVQYRRNDPERFLFSLRDPEETLQDVTASAIRETIGKNDLDFILTEGRAEIAIRTQELLQQTLDSYNTGLTVYEVNLQDANFPAAVEESVQDAIKAREDKEREILQAQTYTNDLVPVARGAAARQLQDAEAYRAQVVNHAQGESSRFAQILAAYQMQPEVTRERIYLETLEYILANSSKVLVDTEGGNNLLYLPLDQLMQERSQSRNPASSASSLPSSAPAETRPETRLSGAETLRR